eukprot:2375581-Prorocentrum_lima.AAC.1
MTSSLVGSEMCIRDRLKGLWQIVNDEDTYSYSGPEAREPHLAVTRYLGKACLLYTSDAADDM